MFSVENLKIKFLHILPLIILAILNAYIWISRFGFTLPANFWMLMLEPQNVILASIFTIVSLTAIALSIIKLNQGGLITILAWNFYLPVIWNVTIPMFIAFMTIIGLIYTPWLIIVENPFGNLLVNGLIIVDREIKNILNTFAYILIIVGLTIYITSLYQLLTSKIKGHRIVTWGLYSINRHPQYMGIILWTLGISIIGWRPINYISWETIAYAYVLLAEIEEMKLASKNIEYREYIKRVSGITPLDKFVKNRLHRIIIYTIIYLLSIYSTIKIMLKYTAVLKTLG